MVVTEAMVSYYVFKMVSRRTAVVLLAMRIEALDRKMGTMTFVSLEK